MSTGTSTAAVAPATVDQLRAEVLERCPRPIGVHQVAVVLESCGYNPSKAAALGARDVIDLATTVWQTIDASRAKPARRTGARTAHPRATVHPRATGHTSTDVPMAARTDAQVTGERRADVRDHLRRMAGGVLYSSPWLVAMGTLLVGGVSYWTSAVATPDVSVALTLALVAALVTTAPFIQAFARRGSFYHGFSAQNMLSRVVARTLELGLVVSAVVAALLWVVRQEVLGTGTPDTNRLLASATFAIAAFELGLAALYLRRAFKTMLAIVAPGAAYLIYELRDRGYVNPLQLAWDQVWVVAIMAAAAWVASAVVLAAAARGRQTTIMWRPKERALVRAVAPYAAYGVGYAAVVAVPQLVAGGLLHGHFSYDQPFALTSGAALVVLVPSLAQVHAASDRFGAVVAERMRRLPLSAVHELRREVLGWWRTHVTLTLAIGGGVAIAVGLIAPELGVPVVSGLAAHRGLFWACLGASAALPLGLLSAQLLFCLSEPGPAVRAAWLGIAGGIVVPVIAGAATGADGPALGAIALVTSTTTFAGAGLLGTWRVLRRPDLAWYRAL